MNLLLNPATGLRVKHKQWTIGPYHDPYSAELLMLYTVSAEAHLYWNGLGTMRFTLFVNKRKFREEEFHDSCPPNREELKMWKTKINLLAKRYVGARFDEAEEELLRAEGRMESVRAMERAAGWDATP